MTHDLHFNVAPTTKAPTDAIKRIEPTLFTDCSKCEGNINIGVFFDGTNNNRKEDKPDLKHSNIPRLFDTYWNASNKGYYPRYVPGVGSSFPEIREETKSKLGNSFGNGCEGRVLFALLHVLNSIHMAAFENSLFLNADQVTALCCNSFVQSSADNPDCVAIGKLGHSYGLLMPLHGEGMRATILRDLAKRLEAALVKGRPIIKECFIDVFGFSRGAAQARVFCNWLDEILIDGKLAGVMLHFRFLGLMDTVASAGFVSSVNAAINNVDGGHSGWAEPRHLRIPKSIKNCVHMVAAHELRKNFPVDTITVDGDLPAHCQEFVYPGAHSDVGGGYAPGELGIAFDANQVTADAQKLSQIPLNHMLQCAIAAGAPMDKGRAKDPLTLYDPFAIAPIVQQAYDDFVSYSTRAARPLHEYLQSYLNWRWEVRLSYRFLNHVSKANEKDRALLIEYNKKLIADAEFLDNPPGPPSPLTLALMPTRALLQQVDVERGRFFEAEARTVLALARAAPSTDVRLRQLFDLFVHDSLAGFDHNALELSGYWHYRRGFLGSEKRQVVQNDSSADDDRAVA